MPGPEPFIWTAALLYLALLDPYGPALVSFCPLHNLGFSFCPGCGLGHSVSYFLHGDITGSFACHPLGIFATIVLTARTITAIVKSSARTKVLQRIHTS